MEHEGHNEIPPEGGGVVHVCSCGWRSRKCFSPAIASCAGMDHRELAEQSKTILEAATQSENPIIGF